jgi:hypothetical protein
MYEIDVASPCDEDWSRMAGEGAVRRCEACAHEVHDLSAMRREDAHALLQSRGEARLCVRYRVDASGELIFADDAPVGRLSAQLDGARRLLAAAALAAPLLLSACEPVPAAPTPAAQAPLVIQEGQPVQIAPIEALGAARPPAFTRAEPAAEAVEVEVVEEPAPIAEVVVEVPAIEEAPRNKKKPKPRYRHKGKPPKEIQEYLGYYL